MGGNARPHEGTHSLLGARWHRKKATCQGERAGCRFLLKEAAAKSDREMPVEGIQEVTAMGQSSASQRLQEMSDAERRQDRRLPIRVLVEYECLEDFLVDYTANISIGGMFIKTDKPLEVGTRFRLRFQLPDMSRPIDTIAEVRWNLPPEDAGPMAAGMGIVFEELGGSDQAHVERLLETWE